MVKEWDLARLDIAKAIHKVTADWDAELELTDILGLLVRPPENIRGDFAFPCFRFAKTKRLAPPKIAEELAVALADCQSVYIEKVSAAGAFCNFDISLSAFAKNYFPQITTEEYFSAPKANVSKQKIMVEFSQPNTHKEFHVGHARNFCLGDSIVRILRYLGHDVYAVNYPGDEGTHIAKCLWFIEREKRTAPGKNKGEWLGKMYVEANQYLDSLEKEEQKTCNEEISKVLQAIESKSGELYEKWRETRQWSLDMFEEVYAKMDVHFDRYFFESEVSEESQKLVDEYLAKGVFVEDDGAVGVDFKEEKLGFMIVRKRDGNTLYATKDLVLAKRKFEEFDIDTSVYVVASEQNMHFKQVFRTLERMGFEQAKNCYHLSYGMVTLPDGKMSSRKGNTVSFKDLDVNLGSELQTVLQKYSGRWSDEEIQECQRRLSVGAIRYGMLATDPVKDVVFSMKDWLSFEGNSGPYLMYTYARTCSIADKAKEISILPSLAGFETLEGDEVRDLVKYMHDFNRVVVGSAEQYKPSVLCHFLYDACKSFNRFYAHHSIIKADTAEQGRDRLALVLAFSNVLHHGLNLLGITPPERM